MKKIKVPPGDAEDICVKVPPGDVEDISVFGRFCVDHVDCEKTKKIDVFGY